MEAVHFSVNPIEKIPAKLITRVNNSINYCICTMSSLARSIKSRGNDGASNEIFILFDFLITCNHDIIGSSGQWYIISPHHHHNLLICWFTLLGAVKCHQNLFVCLFVGSGISQLAASCRFFFETPTVVARSSSSCGALINRMMGWVTYSLQLLIASSSVQADRVAARDVGFSSTFAWSTTNGSINIFHSWWWFDYIIMLLLPAVLDQWWWRLLFIAAAGDD